MAVLEYDRLDDDAVETDAIVEIFSTGNWLIILLLLGEDRDDEVTGFH